MKFGMELQYFFLSPFHAWLSVFSFENTKLIKFEYDLMGCIVIVQPLDK